MPAQVIAVRSETPADEAFLSGAALAHLHVVVVRAEVSQTLLRERLAFQAAEACVSAYRRLARRGAGDRRSRGWRRF